MSLNIKKLVGLPPLLSAAQTQADKHGKPRDSIHTTTRLVLSGGTLLCDLRDDSQAAAFAKWNEQQPDLANVVKTVTLRTWLLWPRLRNMSWESRTVEINITVEADGMKTMDLVEIAENGVGEGQYHKDYYDVSLCVHTSGCANICLQRCQCSVQELLEDANLDIGVVEAMNGHRFTPLEAAEFIAQMSREVHQECARARLMRSPVQTCGRQWNRCRKCNGSKVFICTDGEIVAAAKQTQPPATESTKSDSRQTRARQIERGELCTQSDDSSDVENRSSFGIFRRAVADLYDPFRYDKRDKS